MGSSRLPPELRADLRALAATVAGRAARGICAAALLAGCGPVDLTTVRVRDPGAVGVVDDDKHAWLLPPDGRSARVDVYRSQVLTASLTRSTSGAIDYTAEHWALGKRIDTTPLMDPKGEIGWSASPSASKSFTEAIARGGDVRLRDVRYVRETGPGGLCNGTLFDSCISNPAVPMSLATDSRNIDELRIVRTPVRPIGIGELVLGSVAVGFAAVDGAVLFPAASTEPRNIGLAVGAGALVVGGLLIADGLWRVLSPTREFVYRPAR